MKDPTIPMSPSQLPQQRIREVVGLPPRPESFDSIAGYGVVSPGTPPRNMSTNAIYLCQVEWAWSPMHNRLDAYYLHRGRSDWTLWTRYWDDNWGEWEYTAVASVPRRGVELRVAAIHLLLDFWSYDRRESDVDRYHWINEEGILDVADIEAIADAVWDAPEGSEPLSK